MGKTLRISMKALRTTALVLLVGAAACVQSGDGADPYGTPPATCNPAPPKGTYYCYDAGYLFCNSSPSVQCCSPSYPYLCSSKNTCYSSAEAAATACGTACTKCGP